MRHPATYHVHWPNQSVHMCDAHKLQAERIAALMYFNLTSTPSTGEECLNCVKESEKKGGGS